jgi:hypothetical protein
MQEWSPLDELSCFEESKGSVLSSAVPGTTSSNFQYLITKWMPKQKKVCKGKLDALRKCDFYKQQ